MHYNSGIIRDEKNGLFVLSVSLVEVFGKNPTLLTLSCAKFIKRKGYFVKNSLSH
jgi:hypothetical protein